VNLAKPDFWKNNKRYYDLKSYWRNLFGCTVYKLQIDAGFTCPNRDGHVAVGGCIYCDGRGSKLRQHGPLPSITDQILSGKKYYTRPDCLSNDIIDLLSGYAKKYHVWVELGLQSVHEKTLQFINRGHSYQQFLDAVNNLSGRGLNICVHIIIGLPGENDEDVHVTARTLAALPVGGIKIHSLLALDGTVMGDMYKQGTVPMITKEKYASLTADVLELLPPRMVVQRLTADGYRDIFLAPAWAANKLDVLNAIHKELERRNSLQGMRYK
jgi:radical SAM protein (TIGR01212 family)